MDWLDKDRAYLAARFQEIVKDFLPANQTIPPVLLERLVEAQSVLCRCASRTCGPHRCWPSKAGWVGIGLLLTYAIFMHSFFFSYFDTTTRSLERAQQAALAQLQARNEASAQQSLAQVKQQWADFLTQCKEDWWHRPHK